MRKKTILVCFLSLLIFSCKGWADFRLSVVPYEGGNSLRFGRVLRGQIVNKEVRVKVTSDLGVKYQVRQRLLEPLKDERGQVLNPGAIKFYTLRGSNSYGSLYQTSPLNLNTMDRILYSSSSQGWGDSFTIVYSVDGNRINTSGKFLGRILYTLVPRGIQGQEKRVIFNIYLNTEKKFEVTLTTSSKTARLLRISTDKKRIEGFINIAIKGTLGGVYKITQVIPRPFKSEKADILDTDILKFLVKCEKGKSHYSSYAPLVKKPLLIYTSTPEGNPDDIVIKFHLPQEEVDKLPRGRFRTGIIYKIESGEVLLKRVPVDIELDVKPIFEIEIIPETREGLYFRNLKPLTFQQKEITVRIKTNLNESYCVVQRLSGPLTNERGDKIPLRFFTMREELMKDRSGRIFFSQLTPLKSGDTVVFISDEKGSPSEFRIIYSLEAPRDVKAGDYFANLSFSLVRK